MQQLNAVQAAAFTQNLDQLKHLVGREAELGFFTAGRLPLTGALRCQTGAHTQTRNHVQALGLFQHDGDFGHLFDNQIDLMAHLLADQRQTNIFTVFITVTDDHATRHTCMRQHGHQLGFRASFQPQRFTGVDQRFDHATMLVHLNRVDQEVIAFIAIGFTGAFKRGVNRAQTMLQDLREAEQRR